MPGAIRDILLKLCNRENLSRDEARSAFEHVMSGEATESQIGGLVKPDRVDALVSHLEAVYPTKVGKKPEIFVTTATDGAKVID